MAELKTRIAQIACRRCGSGTFTIFVNISSVAFEDLPTEASIFGLQCTECADRFGYDKLIEAYKNIGARQEIDAVLEAERGP
jgi:hypothetical protein